jgi:hypothetical protein
MLTDFTTRRPEFWPTLARDLYEVYEVGPTSAEVKEGSLKPFVIWERDHYDWSITGRVRWTVRASNYCTAGSYVEARVHPAADRGATVNVEWNRTGIGVRGRILIALVVLTRGAIIRRKVFEYAFDRALQNAVGLKSSQTPQ